MTAQPGAPSTARMIDYWLGGDQHYPIDVLAARAFEGAYGPCADIFRSLRSFSGRAARHIAAEGVDQFLVFGAGVPAQGNVHEVVGGARVLYTDIDPEIVAKGKDLLGTQQNVDYMVGDAADLSSIDSGALDRVLPDRATRPVGLVFLGLAAFLDNTTLVEALDAMYDFAPAGSRLAFDFDAMELAAYPEALAMMGPGFHMRDPAKFGELLGRWEPTVDGIVPVAKWRPDGAAEQVPDAFWGGVAIK